MTIRIAMWSGPRNLSTAMMYSFAARGDCRVADEPFYAAYLAETRADHPMRDAVLQNDIPSIKKVLPAIWKNLFFLRFSKNNIKQAVYKTALSV